MIVAIPLTSSGLINNIKLESKEILEKKQSVTNITRELILIEAKKHLNKRYVWGSKGPNTFDCSGFTSYVLNRFQLDIPSGSSNQYLYGKDIDIKDAQKGDLIFFSKSYMDKTVKHVGLIEESKDGVLKVIHATTSKGIIIEDINKSTYWKPKLLKAKTVIDNVYLETSNKLMAHIADHESFMEYPVKCNGTWAVGYGHLVRGKELKKYQETGITKEEALELLKKDILINEMAVRKLFKNIKLTEYQFDALVSISYNSGIGNLKKKKLTKLILENKTLTEEDFLNTLSDNVKKNYKGLVKRRKLEYQMFNNTYIIKDIYNLLEYKENDYI